MIEKKRKKGQEEIVGFAMIIVIVMVLLLVFLGFSLRDSPKKEVESYEVEGFISSFLQYTTTCKDSSNEEYFSLKDLIIECGRDESNLCLDGKWVCNILNITTSELASESWKFEKERVIKGYKLDILVNTEGLISIEEGNIT